MNKKIIIGIAVIIALIIAAFSYLYLAPAEESEIPVYSSPKNTLVYAVLVEGGLNESIVDITDERTLIGIEIDPDMYGENVAFYAMGAAASIAPETPDIIVQLFLNGTFSEEYSVKTQAVIDFTEERITEQEFDNLIKKE